MDDIQPYQFDKSNRHRVLVIDDEPAIAASFEDYLSELGYSVLTANDAENGRKLFFSNQIDIVFLDINLPKISGLRLLEEFKNHNSDTIIIMISAIQEVDMVVKCIQLGAYDYLVKPIIDFNQIQVRVERALQERVIRYENRQLKQKLSTLQDSTRLIGHSPQFRKVLDLVAAVAPYESTVLITGESGTGKELVARAIHDFSPRSTKQFIAVNCGSIPATLLESTLFGHEKGSFTGAGVQKLGLFEESNQGTIFLDEITETSSDFQIQLLRVLETQCIRRVGGNHDIQLDLRIIAATNQDIEQSIADNRFRPDLYYRINVFKIAVPPLRDRKTDIPLLTQHHLQRLCTKMRKETVSIKPEILEAFNNYHWPGNIRELVNTIENALIRCSGNEIGLNDLPPTIGNLSAPVASHPRVESYKSFIGRTEHTYFTHLLRTTNGNITKAAKLAGFSRQHLHVILKRLNLIDTVR